MKKIVIAVLLFLAFLAFLAPAVAAGQSVETRAQTILHLLDYVSVDYPEFVKGGKVLDEAEYQEQLEFSSQVLASLQSLPEVPAKRELLAKAQTLKAKITEKAAGKQVSSLANELRWDVIPAYDIFAELLRQGIGSDVHYRKHQAKTLGEVCTRSDFIADALRQSIDYAAARLESGLTLLASVGSTAPFIGLFGTVWGIYHALVRIGITGQASLAEVAGPVGEALIMTAVGLGVAIPAVLLTTPSFAPTECCWHNSMRWRTICTPS